MSTHTLPMPQLIAKRSKEIYKLYQEDENWAVIVHLVASKYKKTVHKENAYKFILDYFMEIVLASSLYFESITNTVMKELEEDDIYKGVRIKYHSGRYLKGKQLNAISGKL